MKNLVQVAGIIDATEANLIVQEGVERIANTYPFIRFVTASIEQSLNEHAFMIPGIGDFGDRYFGTADSGATS